MAAAKTIRGASIGCRADELTATTFERERGRLRVEVLAHCAKEADDAAKEYFDRIEAGHREPEDGEASLF